MSSKKKSPTSIKMTLHKPKLIVFDLDRTLWPFWVDTHFDPPFTKEGDNVVDKYGMPVNYFEDVPRMLDHLKSEGYQLAVASRTEETESAKQLIELFNWKHYFKYIQIYPGNKKTHFQAFKNCAKIDYKDMLFFDDEQRNIADISSIGCCTYLTEDGLTMEVLAKGLLKFDKHYTK